jgi:hypothetical protein
MPATRVRDLLRAGFSMLSKYTGTVLSVFVAQSLVAVGCMFAISVVLVQQFGHLPIFDDAVDGDLVSIIWCVRYALSAWIAIGGLMLGAIVIWELASWFLIGGLAGVFAQQPEGRADTARCFGASGAATYLAYARLALCSLPGYALVLFAFLVGFGRLDIDRLELSLTLPQLLLPIVLASLPGLALWWFFSTVGAYARVELTLRHETHDPSVVMTYLRTLVWVARRPVTLLHAATGWLLWWAITIGFVWLAHDHPMYGAGGAVMLFFLRQVVSLLRMAVQVGVIGGQVALGRTRALPPRRVEVKVEPKS